MIEWTIALRNLRQHRTKTIIIGLLIALAMTVLVAGNSLSESLAARMRSSYRDSYTGDAVVHAETDHAMSLFGVTGLDRLNASVPALPDYRLARESLEGAGATEIAGIVGADATFLHDEAGVAFGTLWGVEPAAYLPMFGASMQILDGAYFESRERGILLNAEIARRIAEESGYRYRAGDTIGISSRSAAGGARIRLVPVAGIVAFETRNPQLAMVSIVDVATARELAGLDVERVSAADLSTSERALLGEVDEGALFGGQGDGPGLFDASPGPVAQDGSAVDSSAGSDGSLGFDVDDPVGDRRGTRADASFDLDRWHFVVAKADGARAASGLIRDARLALGDASGMVVADWQWAAGASVNLIVAVQILFNAVAIVVSVVSVIIIVNTLVISITQRIPEIGTIRAIGGKRRFVRRLITRETLAITGVFGAIGIAVGSLVVWTVSAVGIRADSRFLQMLLGGEIFRPSISIAAIVSSLTGVALMAWIASLYPVRMATRITPLAAMQRG